MRSSQQPPSRTQSVVNVAGGGTFRSAIASARAPQSTIGGGGAGPIRARTAGVGRAARTEAAAPYRSQRPTRAPESVFDRLGGRIDDAPPAGTRVRVSGLNHDVMEDDIKELFSGVGELLHCEIDYDRSGRSKEMAMVIFRRREDAELAVSQFHKRTLDGAPMNVEILEAADPPSRNGVSRGDGVRGRGNGIGTGSVGDGMGNNWREQPSPGALNAPPRAPSGAGRPSAGALPSRVPQSRVAVTQPIRAHAIPNVRAGIFGTALDGEDDNGMDDGQDLDDYVAPAMNGGFMGGAGHGGMGGGGPGGGGGVRAARDRDVKFQVTLVGAMSPNNNNGLGGGGGGGPPQRRFNGNTHGSGFQANGSGGGSGFLQRVASNNGREGGSMGGGTGTFRSGVGGGGGARGGGARRSGGGGGGGAARSKGGGDGRGRGGRGNKIEVSTVDLDAQLEAHMAKR